MCSLAGHFQLLLLEADPPMAECLKFPGNFQTKFIHNTFMPICSRWSFHWNGFSPCWGLNLHCVCPELFSNMRDTKRGGIDLLSGTSGKVVAELWNSLSADAVTPQWCFCSAVPNGLRLHPAWCHPIPGLSQRDPCAADKNSEYMQTSESLHSFTPPCIQAPSHIYSPGTGRKELAKTALRGLWETLKLQLTPL